VPPTTKRTIATTRALITIFFIGTKLLALDVIPREKKFIQNYVLVILISESSRGNTKLRRRVGNNLPVVSMDEPLGHRHTKVRSISTQGQ
jgi:hypothetical protein